MKAIETRYKGRRFRSRLEARWAVFFDTLGIEYRYEYEGFELSFSDVWYLPDFYLPQQGYWIEIKGRYPSLAERNKASDLTLELTLAERPESTYIFYGDIPWPHPTQKGNAIGFGSSVSWSKQPVGSEWSGIEGMSWQQCPSCGKFGIAVLGALFCQECVLEIKKVVASEIEAARLDQPTHEAHLINESPRKTSDAIVNLDFFRFNHKSHPLQLAYAEARAARF